ncbi:MAG: hypothetical protein JRD68_13340 [Deltaproteobacteria bacterium]|nr:hypothetical protein [Deltaproteobacteria bacterium]
MTKQTANVNKPFWESRRWIWIVSAIIAVCVILLILGLYFGWFSSAPEETPALPAAQVSSKLEDRIEEPEKAPSLVMDLNKIEQKQDENLSDITEKRKKEFGLKKSVDIVAKPGETIRIGKEEVPLNKILEEIRKQQKAKPLSPKTFLRQLKIPEEEIRADSVEKSADAAPAASRTTETSRPGTAQTVSEQTKAAEKSAGKVETKRQQVAETPAKKSALRRIFNRIMGKSSEETPAKAERSAPEQESSKRVITVVEGKAATDRKVPAGVLKQVLKQTDSADDTAEGQAGPAEAEPKKEPVIYYGIYLVRAGDNLWNIHFAFLREYLGHLGIEVAPMDDEPIGSHSSGVGRILKYAENMVYIFNLKTRELSEDLNLLEPAEKIIIFNLSRLSAILGTLTPEQLETVRFDGRDLVLL